MAPLVAMRPFPGRFVSIFYILRTAAFRLAPLLAASLCVAVPALAQPDDHSVSLRPTARLAEAVPDNDRAPVFVVGDRIEGQPDLQTVIEGDAQLRRAGITVRSEKITYDQSTDIVASPGKMRVNSRGDRYTAQSGQIRIDAFQGYLLQPTYYLLATGANGKAERIDFIDPDRSSIVAGTYTTCPRPGPDWIPDWMLRADEIELDHEEDVGVARGAVVELKGVPVLALPKLAFPLSDARRSGWLAPTVGLDSTSGVQLTAPWYWNIAPNRDATFTPTVMSRRGVDLAGQFRYLEDNYAGTVDANVMPADRLRQRTRWGLFTRHAGSYDTGLERVGRVGVALNINRVSDDDYWRDFSTIGLGGTSLDRARGLQQRTTRELISDGALTWARGDLSASLSARKAQVLQDVNAPITPPYDQLPRLAMRWNKINQRGLDYTFDADVTRFHRSQHWGIAPNLQRDDQVNGVRGVLDAEVARPMLRPWGFVTPKLQLRASQYQFDKSWLGRRSGSVLIPTASLDSGLVFERNTGLFGRSLRQTLEPRLKYVYTPYRDQSRLPNYDSGAYDFNFATIWSENEFAGRDRVADNNTVTAGLTTRFVDPASGAEALRLALAQRYRFSPQKVTLPGGLPEDRGWSDLMLGAGLHWNPSWGVDAVMQYNTDTHRSSRATVSASYTPAPYHSFSAAFRHERDLRSRHLDLGWQWPLADIGWGRRKELGSARHGSSCSGKWYTVGRLNYSLEDRELVDAITGLEYDAGCWIGRVVFEKIGTGVTSSTKRLMFQLELIGLARLGTTSTEILRDTIPRYQPISSTRTPPSRFQDYD